MISPKKTNDGFFKLKFIAYAWAQLPPEGATFDDYVKYAKFALCEARGYLAEDPIWERYSDEQILIEYYALCFVRDESFRKEFEAALSGMGEQGKAAIDWMDAEIKKNQEALKVLRQTQSRIEQTKEDEFEFVPPVIGR